ncbi:hypothetical protein QEN19_004025 [Hanseniaspora menglaensis]
MDSEEIFSASYSDFEELPSFKSDEESEVDSVDSELSESIKLREELPFTQLEPYKSDIVKLIIENNILVNHKTKSNYSKSHLKKKKVLFKEIHNETIGDVYLEDISLPKKHITFTNRLRLSLKERKITKTKNFLKTVDPKIIDLNFAELIGLPIIDFTTILSFLFFGVFLEDPEYENFELDLSSHTDETVSLIVKYFKYRLESLQLEYGVDKKIHRAFDEDSIEEQKIITGKVLPLLLLLRQKVTRLSPD